MKNLIFLAKILARFKKTKGEPNALCSGNEFQIYLTNHEAVQWAVVLDVNWPACRG